MSRQLIPIDEEEVLKLARLGCTNGEIGDFFGVSDETIRVRFLDILALGRANQRISLRRLQWRSAKDGNVPMQIHLGKQYLGQSDKAEITGKDGGPVAIDAATRGEAAAELDAWRKEMAARLGTTQAATPSPDAAP